MKIIKFTAICFFFLITWEGREPQYEYQYFGKVPSGEIKNVLKMEIYEKSIDVERRLEDLRKEKDVKVYRLEPWGWAYNGGARIFKK